MPARFRVPGRHKSLKPHICFSQSQDGSFHFRRKVLGPAFDKAPAARQLLHAPRKDHIALMEERNVIGTLL